MNFETLTNEQVVMMERYMNTFWWHYNKELKKQSYLKSDEVYDCVMDAYLKTIKYYDAAKGSFTSLFSLNVSNQLIRYINKMSHRNQIASFISTDQHGDNEEFSLLNLFGEYDAYSLIDTEEFRKMMSVLDMKEKQLVYEYVILEKPKIEISKEQGMPYHSCCRFIKQAISKIKAYLEEMNVHDYQSWSMEFA